MADGGYQIENGANRGENRIYEMRLQLTSQTDKHFLSSWLPEPQPAAGANPLPADRGSGVFIGPQQADCGLILGR